MGWPLSSEELSRFWREGILVILPDGQCRWGMGPFEGGEAPASAEETFFLPGFFKNQMRTLRPSRTVHFHWDELPDFLEETLSEPVWEEPSFPEFHRQVLEVQELFQNSELKKVVPCIRWKSSWRPDDREKQILLKNLISHSKHQVHPGYVYAFWDSQQGFIGRTPELLFSRKNENLYTMALAGTHWEGKGIEFLEDPKEKEEHQWVVREILNQLNAFGEFTKENLRTLKFGPIEHLYTPISGQLSKEVSNQELCARLHPTPALGGYPQASAWDWLRNQPEAKWRGNFGGPLLYQSAEETVAIVLIRGLFWNSTESYIPCGCGIVAASEPEREWQELHKKKESVLQMLGWMKP